MHYYGEKRETEEDGWGKENEPLQAELWLFFSFVFSARRILSVYSRARISRLKNASKAPLQTP